MNQLRFDMRRNGGRLVYAVQISIEQNSAGWFARSDHLGPMINPDNGLIGIWRAPHLAIPDVQRWLAPLPIEVVSVFGFRQRCQWCERGFTAFGVLCRQCGGTGRVR